MYCQLSLSGNTFERLIQYRVADSFQPLTVPVPFPANTSSWFDGILVTQVVLNQIANDSLIPINELQPDGTVAPNPAGVSFRAAAVSADAAAEIFFVRVQDAASAGLSQPPSLTQSIPIGFIRMIARVFVDAKGTTQFLLSPDLTLIGELRLPPQVVAAILNARPSYYGAALSQGLHFANKPAHERVFASQPADQHPALWGSLKMGCQAPVGPFGTYYRQS
jgi:hypothetical protein